MKILIFPVSLSLDSLRHRRGVRAMLSMAVSHIEISACHFEATCTYWESIGKLTFKLSIWLLKHYEIKGAARCGCIEREMAFLNKEWWNACCRSLRTYTLFIRMVQYHGMPFLLALTQNNALCIMRCAFLFGLQWVIIIYHYDSSSFLFEQHVSNFI